MEEKNFFIRCKQLRDLGWNVIMLAILVAVKIIKEAGVGFIEVIKLWCWHKIVPPSVTDLVFNTTFLMPFSQVHEQCFDKWQIIFSIFKSLRDIFMDILRRIRLYF